MRTILINLLFVLLLTMTGCSIYKVDIQQGNVIDPKKLEQLKIGMNKKQVVFLIGNPLLTDPFHNNRWDYIHAIKPGGEKLSRKVLTLYFEGNKLVKIDDSRYHKMVTIEK
jgi:outer membrane protein assembly factor BamE